LKYPEILAEIINLSDVRLSGQAAVSGLSTSFTDCSQGIWRCMAVKGAPGFYSVAPGRGRDPEGRSARP